MGRSRSFGYQGRLLYAICPSYSRYHTVLCYAEPFGGEVEYLVRFRLLITFFLIASYSSISKCVFFSFVRLFFDLYIPFYDCTNELGEGRGYLIYVLVRSSTLYSILWSNTRTPYEVTDKACLGFFSAGGGVPSIFL